MKIRNLTTQAVHCIAHPYGAPMMTVCGIDVTLLSHERVSRDAKITCNNCRVELGLPLRVRPNKPGHHQKSGADDIDPLGIIDDDEPDGAFWALHGEIYGY